MTNLSLDQFYAEAEKLASANSIRLGQALWSLLSSVRPDIVAGIVTGSLNDPYYCESLDAYQYQNFNKFIKERW